MNNYRQNQTQNLENCESGSQLFARLLLANTQTQNQAESNRNFEKIKENIFEISELNIDSKIFPHRLKASDVVELSSQSNCAGKTELIFHLISRCLFPNQWRISLQENETICVDLSEFSCSEKGQASRKAILIETESKFNILRLFSIVENRLVRALPLKNSKLCEIDRQHLQKLIKKFTAQCLSNLIVFRCSNSEQFLLALSACENYLKSHFNNNNSNANRIVPIFIDSINSNFHLCDKYNHQLGLNSIDHTQKFASLFLKKILDEFANVVLVLSENCILGANTYNNMMPKWKDLVTKKLEIYSNKDLSINNENEISRRSNINDFYDSTRDLQKELFLKLSEKKPSSTTETLIQTVYDKTSFKINNNGVCL